MAEVKVGGRYDFLMAESERRYKNCCRFRSTGQNGNKVRHLLL